MPPRSLGLVVETGRGTVDLQEGQTALVSTWKPTGQT